MQPKSVKDALRIAQAMGRGNDTILAHINPREAALLKKRGGSGKRNPLTGLLEFDDEEGANRPDEGMQPEKASADNSDQAQKDEGARTLEENNAINADMDKAVQAQKDEAARVMAENDADNAAADAATRVIGLQRNEPFSSMAAENPDSAVTGQGKFGPLGFDTQNSLSQQAFQNQQLQAMGFNPDADLTTQLGKVSPPAPNADVSAATPGPAPMASVASNAVPMPIARPDQLNWNVSAQQDPVRTAVALARNVNAPAAIAPADLPAKYTPPVATPDSSVASTDGVPHYESSLAANQITPYVGPSSATTGDPIKDFFIALNEHAPKDFSKDPISTGGADYGGLSKLYPPATGTSNDLGNISVNKPVSTSFTPGTPTPYAYPVQSAYNNYAYKVPNYNTGINWGMVPGYMPAASGGRIGENNALANALRMLMAGNKS